MTSSNNSITCDINHSNQHSLSIPYFKEVIKITKKIIYGLIGGIVIAFIGLIVGRFIGVNIGGDYFPHFQFMGGNGYEATGYLGGSIGVYSRDGD
ncbi:MAG TPA: hypothetical protein VK121_07380 [Pseudogracilibacillus sp.]|nr:hypothetical protein [Pseudogracilibacillus sp.]